jgi:hypothetical protein
MKATFKDSMVLQKIRAERRAKAQAEAAKQTHVEPATEQAVEHFVAIVGEIRTTLEAIQEANDEHYDFTPEEINWGHVGDVTRTLAGLKEILAVIRGEVK